MICDFNDTSTVVHSHLICLLKSHLLEFSSSFSTTLSTIPWKHSTLWWFDR